MTTHVWAGCFLLVVHGLYNTEVWSQTPDWRAPWTVNDAAEALPPRDNPFVAPQPVDLPSNQNLTTHTVREKTFHVQRVPRALTAARARTTTLKTEADATTLPASSSAVALYENSSESLYFRGSGRGGRESHERLIVEDCTFILDFQEGDFDRWDARRCAIYVEGYNEVIVRRCRFLSRGKHDDPPRKTNASVTVYDTQKVLIEDCYFEGKTNWMRGHVLVFCSGPTTIRRVEITGQLQPTARGERYICGGGIWVGNGLGEGKAGHLHADNPELMIYPSGPLLIEDCLIHNQQGPDNTDGIYVQSIHPFLIRNTRVADWGMDALVDTGFRDTAGRRYQGRPLVNHGAKGVIENCEFVKGLLKVSVGAGGGIIIRNSVFHDAWLMPYIFDGGHWYIVNNRFQDLRGPVVSGRDGRTRGWAPREGMFRNGSQLVWRNNQVGLAAGVTVATLFHPNPNGPAYADAVDADVDLRGAETRPLEAANRVRPVPLLEQLPAPAAAQAGLTGRIGPRGRIGAPETSSR